MNPYIQSGLRLKEERKRLGLTQPAIAEIGGVGKGSQVGYESGIRSPDLDYLQKIGTGGADIMYIVSGQRMSEQISNEFDWALHDKLLELIENKIAKNNLSIRFDKKMELLRLFLSHTSRTDAIDEELIFQTLKLLS